MNYFAEVEQAAFNPSNLVPGNHRLPDKMLQGRFSPTTTPPAPPGPNYQLIPSNAPKAPRSPTPARRAMRTDDGGGAGPNYWPNSFAGPAPDPDALEPPLPPGGRGRAPRIRPSQRRLLPARGTVSQGHERPGPRAPHRQHRGPPRRRPAAHQKRQCALFHNADATWARAWPPGWGSTWRSQEARDMTKEERAAATAQ